MIFNDSSPQELRELGFLPQVPVVEQKSLRKLDYVNPAELLSMYDDVINSKQKLLHPWQIEVSEKFGGSYTDQNPLRFTLVAANGSGKDAFVIAPFAVWFILCKIRSRVIITSSSGTQLTAQTENLIASLCHKVNAFHTALGDSAPFHIVQRHITCKWSGSEIRLFATDEAGKAEGYHPYADYPNAEMAIVVNEAKTVSEDIFEALSRCSGYNYWIEVSTPGAPDGHFYVSATSGKDVRKVTAYDCPHLGQSYIDEAKRRDGEHSALFRSKILAEFTSIDGQNVIPCHIYDSCVAQIGYEAWPKRVGIDLAAGGDECVTYITRGNSVLAKNVWRDKDTARSVEIINDFLTQQGISKDHPFIFIDDGGVGRGVIDWLVRIDWSVNRVLNGWPARRKREFVNLGTEMWYDVARFFQENIWHVEKLDTELRKQLTSRMYTKSNSNNRYKLESKQEAKARGLPSPDHADAFILSLYGLTVDDFLQDSYDPVTRMNTRKQTMVTMDSFKKKSELEGKHERDPMLEDHLLCQLYPDTYGRNPMGIERAKSAQPKKKHSFYSLATLLGR